MDQHEFHLEMIDPQVLTPHRQNYRIHPQSQIRHIEASLREQGFYRNVVIANDEVILAGHGVVLAAKQLGLTEIPVVRLMVDSDHPKALKLLVGDNEIAHLGGVDDTGLLALLQEVHDRDDLMGTGYDDAMLQALIARSGEVDEDEPAVSRDKDIETPLQVTVIFASEADRQAFGAYIGVPIWANTTTIHWEPDDTERYVGKLRSELTENVTEGALPNRKVPKRRGRPKKKVLGEMEQESPEIPQV